MINASVTVCRDEYDISLTGHADFAPRGSDIVCAGVSALCMAFYGAVSEKNISRYCEKYILTVDNGCFRVRIKNVTDAQKRAMLSAFIQVFISGLSAIEEKYPMNLCCIFDIDPMRGSHIGTSEQTMDEKERKEGKGSEN